MDALLFSQIFNYNGLPSLIMFDNNPCTASLFWKGLFKNLGIGQNFSLNYHPQTYRQSKIVNPMILDLLKVMVEERDKKN